MIEMPILSIEKRCTGKRCHASHLTRWAAEMTVDWIEVNRTAHQLGIDHGRNGYLYAERLATEAMEKDHVEDYEFWSAVSAALRPRESSPNNSFNPDSLKRPG